jgi:hypothetical protein
MLMDTNILPRMINIAPTPAEEIIDVYLHQLCNDWQEMVDGPLSQLGNEEYRFK